MNREIKFRIWSGIEMEYKIMAGYLGAYYVQGIDEKDTACMSPMNSRYYPQTPVMQFVGFSDKNGKDIYEGDIDKNHKGFHWAFVAGCFGLKSDTAFLAANYLHSCYKDYAYEIVGNIYQNPELTK